MIVLIKTVIAIIGGTLIGYGGAGLISNIDLIERGMLFFSGIGILTTAILLPLDIIVDDFKRRFNIK